MVSEEWLRAFQAVHIVLVPLKWDVLVWALTALHQHGFAWTPDDGAEVFGVWSFEHIDLATCQLDAPDAAADEESLPGRIRLMIAELRARRSPGPCALEGRRCRRWAD